MTENTERRRAWRKANQRQLSAIFGGDIDPDVKVVAGAMLHDHINQQQFNATGRLICWPSVGCIMDETGLAERTVQDARATLIARGIITPVGYGIGDDFFEGEYVPGRGRTAAFAFNQEWTAAQLRDVKRRKDARRDEREKGAPTRTLMPEERVHQPAPFEAGSVPRNDAVKGARQLDKGCTSAPERVHQPAPDSLRGTSKKNLSAMSKEDIAASRDRDDPIPLHENPQASRTKQKPNGALSEPDAETINQMARKLDQHPDLCISFFETKLRGYDVDLALEKMDDDPAKNGKTIHARRARLIAICEQDAGERG